MMEISLVKILLILVIVFVIFGAGKLPQIMSDVGKGIRSLKEGLKSDEASKSDDVKKI
jgi:sec-independent protein translocase protein TatA